MTEVRWSKLVDTLTSKTRLGSLVWQEGTGPRNLPETVSKGLASTILGKNGARTFNTSIGGAVYELSAGDAFGHGPYELKIWETQRTGEVRAVKALNTNIDRRDFELQTSLPKLYRTVDSLVEREGETAARLLRELEGL